MNVKPVLMEKDKYKVNYKIIYETKIKYKRM